MQHLHLLGWRRRRGDQRSTESAWLATRGPLRKHVRYQWSGDRRAEQIQKNRQKNINNTRQVCSKVMIFVCCLKLQLQPFTWGPMVSTDIFSSPFHFARKAFIPLFTKYSQSCCKIWGGWRIFNNIYQPFCSRRLPSRPLVESAWWAGEEQLIWTLKSRHQAPLCVPWK